MNNISYFNFSCQNEDRILDFLNPKGKLVIACQKEKSPTLLQKTHAHLIDLIITYKTLKAQNSKIAEEILDKIDTLLMETNLINYSPFCIYFQVLKYSYSAYKAQKKKLSKQDRCKILKEIVAMYLENRHEMYMSYGYNDIVFQVMSDSASSRRNGKSGIEKIEEVLQPLGYKKIKTRERFEKEVKGYILPDKDGKKIFKDVLNTYQIEFKFFKKREAKFPDFLIKNGEKIFILEHKMTNGEGGAQNAEINEIIDFMGTSEKNKNVSYISCLQGSYFTQFKNNSGKVKAQKARILSHLKKFPYNYFLNGLGFQKLFQGMENENYKKS